jgi:hypothetical protein
MADQIILMPEELQKFLGPKASAEFCKLLNLLILERMRPNPRPLTLDMAPALHEFFGEEGCRLLLQYLSERILTPQPAPANS